MRPRFVRASYFAWAIVPAAIYAGYQVYGLPHAIWTYDFYGSRSDWARRTYTRCTFVGPYGEFTTYPTDGKCPWVAFFKSRETGQ